MMARRIRSVECKSVALQIDATVTSTLGHFFCMITEGIRVV